MRRAVDYLQTRAEVLPDQLGCYGHSMGSTHTWLVGGWEPRLKALVGNCCLPTYRGIHREQLLHCFPNFVPGIYPETDTPAIAALTAPRPFHLNFGELERVALTCSQYCTVSLQFFAEKRLHILRNCSRHR